MLHLGFSRKRGQRPVLPDDDHSSQVQNLNDPERAIAEDKKSI